MIHLGDITKIDGAAIEPVDVITFGSPCQDLSISGKRAGLAGKRSGLFMEAVRIIREMREATNGKYPAFAVWENVPGAFSSQKGEDFRAVIEELAAVCEPGVSIPRPPKGKWKPAGVVMGDGWSTAWRVMDAQFWGVPQRRRRIALVVDFGGTRAGEILFEQAGLRRYPAPGGKARKEAAAAAGVGASQADGVGCLTCSGFGETGIGYWQEGIKTLRAEGERPSYPSNVVAIGFHGWRSITGSIEAADECAPCMQAKMPPNVVHIDAVGVRQNQSGDVNVSDTAYSLSTNGNATGRNSPLIMHPDIAGTLCASGEGLNRPAGQGNEADLCVCEARPFTLQSFGEYKPSEATSGMKARDCKDATDLIVSAVDCRNLCEYPELSGTIQAKQSGGFSLNFINPIRIRYIVRRLTPLECERLQGFPDGWTDIGPYTDSKGKKRKTSDSARYRALGNSIALPQWRFVLGGIAALLPKGATLGSLFDGIGGFPLVWQEINGAVSARWASEIDDFCIAVTKRWVAGLAG